MGKIRYQDVIDLGFRHIEDSNEVWRKEKGFEYFRVEYKLTKRQFIEWDVEDRTCTVIRIDKDYNILHKWTLPDLETVKHIISLFSKRFTVAVSTDQDFTAIHEVDLSYHEPTSTSEHNGNFWDYKIAIE